MPKGEETLEEKNIVDIYDSVTDKQKEKFKDNIDSKVRVQTDFSKTIKDTDWIEIIEETIPYLDNILRNPNRFIINEEEIVKIELARKITVDSIKHLSKHTNLIQDINKKTGDVRPSKILNINKEESYDTYENKVIYTLIQNTKYFISRKKKTLEILNASGGENGKNNKAIDYAANTKINNQKVNISLALDASTDSGNNKNEKGEDSTEKLLERIAIVERKITDLTSSDVYKIIDKKHITLIRPPIKKTNVILKNVNFQYAMRLWNYLQDNLEDKTQNINEKKDYEDNGPFKGLLDDSFLLDFLILNTLDEDAQEETKTEEKEKQVQDFVVGKLIEKMLEMNSDISKAEINQMIGEKFAIIKYRNLVTTKEIQKIFAKNINKYIAKISKKI